MSYAKQTWADGDATKPVSAARMQNIEDGLEAAANSGVGGTGDFIIDSDTDASGAGDIIFETKNVERFRVNNGDGSIQFTTASMVTSGDHQNGLLLGTGGNTYSGDPGNGNTINLMKLALANTHVGSAADTQLIGLRIAVNHTTVDNGAGISIGNTGQADCVYLSAAGVAGAGATTPSGIGLDINRNGSVEQSSNWQGYGIQIVDFTQTSIAPPNGTLIYLNKANNADSQNVMLKIRTNQQAISLVTPEGGTYAAGSSMIAMTKTDGTLKWKVTADGNQSFGSSVDIGFTWALPSGNAASLLSGIAGNSLTMKGGSGGLRLTANDASLKFKIDNTGISFFGVATVARPSAYTVTNHVASRSLDESAATTAQVANVLGTVIADLKAFGLLQ